MSSFAAVDRLPAALLSAFTLPPKAALSQMLAPPLGSTENGDEMPQVQTASSQVKASEWHPGERLTPQTHVLRARTCVFVAVFPLSTTHNHFVSRVRETFFVLAGGDLAGWLNSTPPSRNQVFSS